VILTDTGPLVALIDTEDKHYNTCTSFANSLRVGPLVTPSACWVEAMYLLHRAGGYPLQAELWRAREIGLLRIHESFQAEYDRMVKLMDDYRDSPMDVADAAVVAAAEALNTDIVFTIDGHFFAYRTRKGPLTVVPG
jgi:predicted nucleic acid-binding protein